VKRIFFIEETVDQSGPPYFIKLLNENNSKRVQEFSVSQKFIRLCTRRFLEKSKIKNTNKKTPTLIQSSVDIIIRFLALQKSTSADSIAPSWGIQWHANHQD